MNTDTLEDAIEQALEHNASMFDTASEAKIAEALTSYGIPFFYKEPTIVYDQGKNTLIYPAFTLPSYGGTIIDYLQESYGDRYKYEALFQQNQIPSVLITPEDMKSSTWQQQLYQQLNQTYQQSQSYQQPSGYIQPR